MKPGIYPNMHDRQYREMKAVSQSDLKTWVKGGESSIDRTAALIGSLVHCWYLDPDQIHNQFKFVKSELNYRKKAIREQRDRIESERHVTIVRPSERDAGHWLCAAIYKDETASKIRKAFIDTELVCVSQFGGTLVKCKIDATVQGNQKFLLDLKTTSMDRDLFENSVIKYGYHVQGAWYHDIYEQLTGESLPVMLLCVDKATCDVWTRTFSNDELWYGRSHYRDLLTLYERYSTHEQHEDLGHTETATA